MMEVFLDLCNVLTRNILPNKLFDLSLTLWLPVLSLDSAPRSRPNNYKTMEI